ncbi:hypothetical protein P8610_18670 [Fictibacillus sp. UD]
MIGAQGARLSARTSGQVRPLTAQRGKGLTACPAESEHLERKSRSHIQLGFFNKNKKGQDCH